MSVTALKYIFRYTILNYYTTEKKISFQDLKSVISSEFSFKDKIQSLIETFKETIESLIVNKQQQKIVAIINEKLQAQYPGDYPQLASVWLNERHQVYSKICSQSNQTCSMLKNLSWNVCTPIASKYECKKNMMANVKLETNAKNEKNIFLELNKNDLSTILQSLQQATEFLDKALLQN